MDKLLLKVLLSGLILRIFFMSFFYHPDLKSQYFHSQFLKSGVTNIYAFISQHQDTLPYRDTYNYPPAIYYLQGTWESVVHLLSFGYLDKWLNDWDLSAYSFPRLPYLLFLLKIPYLVLDVVLGLLLIKYSSQSSKILTAYLWTFNPLSLYAIYMVGQFDIIPTLLVFSAYLLVNKKRLSLAVLLIAIATAFKTFPVILLPFILFRSKNLYELGRLCLIFILVSLAWILPFITTTGFISSVFQSALGQRLLAANIDIGFGERLPIFLIYFAVILTYSYLTRLRYNLFPEFLSLTAAMVIFAHFHAQWAIWSLPFFLLLIAAKPKLLIPSLWFTVFYFIYLFLLSDQFVLVGMFIPMFPALITVPPLVSIFGPVFNPGYYQGLIHSLISGILLVMILHTFKLFDHAKS